MMLRNSRQKHNENTISHTDSSNNLDKNKLPHIATTRSIQDVKTVNNDKDDHATDSDSNGNSDKCLQNRHNKHSCQGPDQKSLGIPLKPTVPRQL